MTTITLLEEAQAAITKLSDADAGALVKALIMNEETPELSDMAGIVYPFIKGQVDRLEDIRVRRSESGRIGGSKKQTESKGETNGKQTESKTETNDRQTESKPQAHNHNHNHNHNQEEKAPTGPKRRADSFSELFSGTEMDQTIVEEAWEAWKEVRRVKKVPWTADAARLNANKLITLSRGDPIRAVKILEQSTERGWQGLFDLKDRQDGKGKIDWEAV